MGRMRRMRRYKACDPFAKHNNKVKEPVYNLAPKKGESDDHFHESKRFLELQRGIERAMAVGKRGKLQQEDRVDIGADPCPLPANAKKKKKKKQQKDGNEGKKSLEQGVNESKKDYFRRLDANVNDAINTTMMDSRTLRKKRKLHLKARDEKKKKKAKKDHEQDDNRTSEVTHKFGEYVEAPPDITALPRKANSINNTSDSTTTTTTKKYKGLKLMSLLEGQRDVEPASSKVTTELSKEALEKERQRAIDAYRLMKKQNVAKYAT